MKSCEALKQDIEYLQEMLNDLKKGFQRLTTQTVIVPSEGFVAAITKQMKEIEEEIVKLQAEYDAKCAVDTHVIQPYSTVNESVVSEPSVK